MELLFKFLGWVFVVLFSISALLQLNDPDPILWVVIYSCAALVALGFLFNKVPYGVLLILGLIALFGFVYQLPEMFEGFDIGNGDIKNIEEAREAFGLLIIAIVMFLFAFEIRFKNKSKV